jgi:molybdopterin-containing oxidoreductase family iron-sulfur binding subunit
MEGSRRGFLKLAGILALGLGTKPMLGVSATDEASSPRAVRGEKALTARRWAMVIDTRRIE